MKLSLLLGLLFFTTFINAQIVTGGGIVQLEACDFEDECPLIELDTATSNQWQMGLPSKPFFDTAYSVPNCILTDTVLSYAPSNLSSFQIALYDDGGMMFNVGIRFWHKFESDTLLDGGYIEYSYDYGDTWYNVHDHYEHHPEFEFYSENLYGEEDTLMDGTHAFTGTADWTYTQLQWIWIYPIRVEVPDTFLLRFNFISDDIDTEKDGWMIDDISTFYAIFGGVDEYENAANLMAYPNPATEFTTIQFENPESEALNISVVNTLGQEVTRYNEITGTNFQINTGNLPSGLYQIRLLDGVTVIATTKLLVNQ